MLKIISRLSSELCQNIASFSSPIWSSVIKKQLFICDDKSICELQNVPVLRVFIALGSICNLHFKIKFHNS